MRNSPRSSALAALSLVLALLAGSLVSAHRRDEYLQAARLAIDPDRVQIDLDLTPGIAVAARVLAEIDIDRNQSISTDEARAYAGRLLNAIALDVDGMPLRAELLDSTFPAVDAVFAGQGTIHLDATATMPRLAGGVHRLHFRNTHRADIGVYLANALVPASDRVAVTAQRRDMDQRDLIIEYTLNPAPRPHTRRWLPVGSLAGGLILLFVVHRQRARKAL